MGALGAIRRQLQQAGPAFRDVLFGFGVVMPYTTFTATGAEMIPDVLLDRRSFRQSLTQYVTSLETYWNGEYERKRGRRYRGLTERELHEARQVLRPDLETALSLGGGQASARLRRQDAGGSSMMGPAPRGGNRLQIKTTFTGGARCRHHAPFKGVREVVPTLNPVTMSTADRTSQRNP